MAEEKHRVIVGSRKSELAMIQTRSVVSTLQKMYPNCTYEIVGVSTTGDKIQDVALSKIGESSLFIKELEIALNDKRVDFVVHSLKDMPASLTEGMAMAAVCVRDDPHDALVLHPTHQGKNLASLPKGSVLGSSSLRRVAQLGRKFPHLSFSDVRGNLNTRLRKLDEGGKYDGLVLAVAGLERMGWKDRISQVIDYDICLYAVSQGALAVEAREDDENTHKMLAPLTDPDTLLCCLAERSFLMCLKGGCSVPVGVSTHLQGQKLEITGGVYSLDGSQEIKETMSKDIPSPDVTSHTLMLCNGFVIKEGLHVGVQIAVQLGVDLGNKLLEKGAEQILKAARESMKK
jgi:hydroxymethylbilane synthase